MSSVWGKDGSYTVRTGRPGTSGGGRVNHSIFGWGSDTKDTVPTPTSTSRRETKTVFSLSPERPPAGVLTKTNDEVDTLTRPGSAHRLRDIRGSGILSNEVRNRDREQVSRQQARDLSSAGSFSNGLRKSKTLHPAVSRQLHQSSVFVCNATDDSGLKPVPASDRKQQELAGSGAISAGREQRSRPWRTGQRKPAAGTRKEDLVKDVAGGPLQDIRRTRQPPGGDTLVRLG